MLETVYQLVSRTDDETTRILRDVIVVAVHANPDGMQMVSKCYMQAAEPSLRRTCSPRLYEKYAGHDNNRDFYMSNTKESQNMNKMMYWEWLPQIMYNHHQSGPAGTVIFSPPFRDPFNYNFDPMIVTGLDMVGAAMHNRFLQEGKPGFTMRSGASYSTWWNGGLRTTAYFQNIIGLLTEIIGNPTPSQIPAIQSQILPRADLPAPIAPQAWQFRQSIDYSVTANYAVLDLASRYKDQFLYNIYKMGANQIARGSKRPLDDLERGYGPARGGRPAVRRRRSGAAGADAAARGGGRGGAPAAARRRPAIPRTRRRAAAADVAASAWRSTTSVLKDPARRDPRVFVIPADQADFATATKFINTLRYIGVEVHQATAPLAADGKNYPAGSYVVKTAQAGRAHVLDMFEPQDHPNDMDERGIPRRPYDSAGWTLAYQMGVKFDRLFDDVTGSFKEIDGLAAPLPGTISGTAAAGYLLSPAINDSFTIANRVLKANGEVFRLGGADERQREELPGRVRSTWRRALPRRRSCSRATKELGVNADATGRAAGRRRDQARARAASPCGTRRRGRCLRAGRGSSSSGSSSRFTIVCGAGFDDTALRSKFDVIVMPSGAAFRRVAAVAAAAGVAVAVAATKLLPAVAQGDAPGRRQPQLQLPIRISGASARSRPAPAPVRPPKPTSRSSSNPAVSSSPRVRRRGASPIRSTFRSPTISSSGNRGSPNAPLSSDKYYVPGSVLRVAVDQTALVGGRRRGSH